jgi:hypothetical protein
VVNPPDSPIVMNIWAENVFFSRSQSIETPLLLACG